MLQALDAGYNAGDMLFCYFPAYGANGESLTITGLAVTDIEVYKDGGTTQRASDNGYTLLDTDGIDFDGSTGLHGFKIDTSDNSDASFWADGSHYLIWVDAVTINGQTVRFGFTCRLGVLLRPTTAGRKLDVSSGGEAGVDWANVGSPTTTVNLSGTTVKTATDVETDTADIQSRLPAALVGGRMDASVGAMANDVITAAAHDESTAFPIKSADSGSTQIARVGADGDTLETLSDQLDAKSSQASVDTLTTTVGVAGAGLTEAGGTGDQFTAIPWNASWDAEVQSEVQDAIEANHLDHLLAADYNPASKPGVSTALLNELVESDGGVSRFTANALEQAPAGGGGGGDTYVFSPVLTQLEDRIKPFVDAPLYIGDTSEQQLAVYSKDENGTFVPDDLTLYGDMTLYIEDGRNAEVQTVLMADLDIDGSDNNLLLWTPDSGTVGTVRKLKAALRKDSDGMVIARGTFDVQYQPGP